DEPLPWGDLDVLALRIEDHGALRNRKDRLARRVLHVEHRAHVYECVVAHRDNERRVGIVLDGEQRLPVLERGPPGVVAVEHDAASTCELDMAPIEIDELRLARSGFHGVSRGHCLPDPESRGGHEDGGQATYGPAAARDPDGRVVVLRDGKRRKRLGCVADGRHDFVVGASMRCVLLEPARELVPAFEGRIAGLHRPRDGLFPDRFVKRHAACLLQVRRSRCAQASSIRSFSATNAAYARRKSLSTVLRLTPNSSATWRCDSPSTRWRRKIAAGRGPSVSSVSETIRA